MTKFLVNPFFVYTISFTIVLMVYSLGWSGLYPPLSLTLIFFLICTFVISSLVGIIVQLSKRIEYTSVPWSDKAKTILYLLCIGYFFEFLYNGGIPLVMILRGETYNYVAFGIPTFHVLLVTLNSFASIYIFHQLISNFSKSRLFYFALSIAPSILIVNRAMLLMILASCLFIYILSLRKLRPKNITFLAVIILTVLYLFGIMGNLRQTGGRTTTSEYILDTSKASNALKKSVVPNEYIWAYLYISSPIANLQNAINKASDVKQSWGSFFNYVLLPDFISKRTGSILEIHDSDVPRIVDWLTVSTFYAKSYFFLGWLGMILIFLFFVITSFLYVFLLNKKSKYYVTGLSILSTVALYNTFDNMHAFTGLIFQLVYPLIFGYVKFPNITFNLRAKST